MIFFLQFINKTTDSSWKWDCYQLITVCYKQVRVYQVRHFKKSYQISTIHLLLVHLTHKRRMFISWHYLLHLGQKLTSFWTCKMTNDALQRERTHLNWSLVLLQLIIMWKFTSMAGINIVSWTNTQRRSFASGSGSVKYKVKASARR